MATPGSAEESFQLADHYRQLTDEELIALALQKEELTEAAQQTLATEIQTRRLTVPPLDPKGTPRQEPPYETNEEDDQYAEDRKLVEIRNVWSERDARQLQGILDTWGIPFFMGKEKATSVDDATFNFAEGVPVSVMQIGSMTALQALQNQYLPHDEPPDPGDEYGDNTAIHCPKCHSSDVVFDELIGQESNADGGPKYRWTCVSCGNEWEDEGIETEN